jgi:hypothetical protein
MSADYQPIDKSDLLRVIRLERNKLEELLDGLSAEKLGHPGVEVDWSIKDILAHIAAWERVAVDIVSATQSGITLPTYVSKVFENVDVFNAKVYEKHKAWSISKIQEEFSAAHQEFIKLIASLGEDFVFRNLPFEGAEKFTIQYMISANTHWHYREHVDSIKNWLSTDL